MKSKPFGTRMALSFPTSEVFRLNGFTVDPSRNLIMSAGNDVTVEPKVMEVLCFLVSRQGEVVSRSTIIDAVWGVAYGGDESLTRAISLLRKALPSDRDPQGVIRTISKRGYSLTADIQAGLPPNTQHERAPPVGRMRRTVVWAAVLAVAAVAILSTVFLLNRPRPPSRIAGIVVLVDRFDPVASSSSGAALADSLTAALARFDQIKVRRYQPGMNVDTQTAYVYVVAGAMKSTPDGGRLTIQLQDYSSKTVVWSGGETFEGPTDKATSALAAELELAILQAAKTEVQKKPTAELSPWELILLGTWVPGADREWQGPPTAESYWLWERAIEKDPDFALAHASLAQVMANFALFDPPSDTSTHAARAGTSANRAVVLAPYDASVLFQIALYYRYAGKRDDAAATLRRVIDLEPDNIMARIELEYVTGQCSAGSVSASERLRMLEQSLPPANPAHWVIASHRADMALARGDYRLARTEALRSRQIVRQIWSSMTLAAANSELGQSDEAVQIVTEHKGQWPALDYRRFAEGNVARWCMGGDTTHASEAFRKLGDTVASKQP